MLAATASEVVHILKCIPVEVKLRKTSGCYSELPVEFRNISYFLTPKSRIITQHGSERDCSDFLPVMYQIEDAWIAFNPRPTAAITPQSLQPMTKPQWKYLTPAPLATSGIYSQTDLDKLRDHLMFPAEKPAVLNSIARGFSGRSLTNPSISIRSFLDEQTIEGIAKSAAEKLWGSLMTFGSISAGIIGIYVIIRTIMIVVNTIIHGYTLHNAYGCGLHLLGALWSSVTHLLLHKSEKQTYQTNNALSRPGENRDITEDEPTYLEIRPRSIAADEPIYAEMRPRSNAVDEAVYVEMRPRSDSSRTIRELQQRLSEIQAQRTNI